MLCKMRILTLKLMFCQELYEMGVRSPKGNWDLHCMKSDESDLFQHEARIEKYVLF